MRIMLRHHRAGACRRDVATTCAATPGAATPACIIDNGHFQIETAIIDWSRCHRGGIANDAVSFAYTELHLVPRF